MCKRIGHDQEKVKSVWQRKQYYFYRIAKDFMPRIREADNKEHMYKRMNIVNRQISHMRKIQRKKILAVVVVEGYGENIKRSGHCGENYLQKEQTV